MTKCYGTLAAGLVVVCCLVCGCAAQQPALARPSVTTSQEDPTPQVPDIGVANATQAAKWDFECPVGTWMYGIDIAGDPSLNALGPLYCTSGGSNNVTKWGAMQGNLPVPVIQWREYGSSTGYSGIALRLTADGVVISAISFMLAPSPTPVEGIRSLAPGQPNQAYGGIGDGETLRASCPPGHIIKGLHGRTNGFNILTVGLRCKEVIGEVDASTAG